MSSTTTTTTSTARNPSMSTYTPPPSTSSFSASITSTSGTPATTPTMPAAARVRFDAECVLIPDMQGSGGGSKRPRMVTKSYSLPLWRKPSSNKEGRGREDDEEEQAHVVLKVALPRLGIGIGIGIGEGCASCVLVCVFADFALGARRGEATGRPVARGLLDHRACLPASLPLASVEPCGYGTTAFPFSTADVARTRPSASTFPSRTSRLPLSALINAAAEAEINHPWA
ncbi:hypothetical protein B0H19DRAFT_1256746 [Mycena capillaripes]|nr:hypothetical protein B0H19DRAFT_1256746 [Mycena capillaripes]